MVTHHQFKLPGGAYLNKELHALRYGQFDPHVYETQFNDGANPSWFNTLDTDNGSQTFTALRGGSPVETQLKTGTTATGDVTNLESAFTLNWSNWSMIVFHVWGLYLDDNNGSKFQMSFGNARWASSITKGFWFVSDNNQGTHAKIAYGGGTFLDGDFSFNSRENPWNYTLKIFKTPNPDSEGRRAMSYVNGRPVFMWSENAGGSDWPNANAYPLRVGVQTNDTAADQTAHVGGILVGVVP